MRKSIILSTTIVVAALVFSSAAVMAQRPGGPGRGGPGPRVGAFASPEQGGRLGRGSGRRSGLRFLAMGRFLDLSEDQRAQIRTVMQGTREEAAPAMKELRTAARELRTARQADSADAAKIGELQTKVTSLRKQVADIMTKTRPTVLAVLTPEQKAKLDERRAGQR